jgi:hypothetical protein
LFLWLEKTAKEFWQRLCFENGTEGQNSTAARHSIRYIKREWILASSASAEKRGEPGRTRTYNPLIKSQLLYH